jgi:hypothetical protein
MPHSGKKRHIADVSSSSDGESDIQVTEVTPASQTGTQKSTASNLVTPAASQNNPSTSEAEPAKKSKTQETLTKRKTTSNIWEHFTKKATGWWSNLHFIIVPFSQVQRSRLTATLPIAIRCSKQKWNQTSLAPP